MKHLMSYRHASARVTATLVIVSALLLADGDAHSASVPGSTFNFIIRPETDATDKVVSIVIEENIISGTDAQPLSMTAPLSFVGMIPFATQISGVAAHDAVGPLAMTQEGAVLPDGAKGRRWRSNRGVSGMATVRYRVALQPAGRGGPPYGAKAGSFGVSGNTSTLLMIPDDLPEGRSTLGWDLSGMVAGSRGVVTGGEGTIAVSGGPERLLDRWVIAGPLQAGQARAENGFNAYTLGKPPFPVAQTMAWARSVYGALARAFGYLGEPRYELLIRTLDAPSYATGTAANAGGGSLITTGSPTYVDGQTDADVANTIAHEMGHQWVGQFGDGGSLWFAEGLNVYVTSTLPCEAGLQPWTACAAQISKWAKAYYGSEGRGWSQARIEAAPFQREDLRLVSYGRGMIYFANLDATIKARFRGRRTLLTALRPLFEARRRGRPITMERWEAWLRKETGVEGVAGFRETVLGGAIIDPVDDAFGPHLERVPAGAQDHDEAASGHSWRIRSHG